MIGIQSIASSIPENYVSNYSLLNDFNISKDFLQHKIGVIKRPIIKQSESCVDLALVAVRNLISQTGIDLKDIQCIVFITQTPHNEGLPHSSAYLHKLLELDKGVACFDVSLGCSGFVYGLSIIKGFMTASGLTKGILVTADPYSKIVNKDDINTSLLFGDAATATLISDTPRYIIGESIFCTDGQGVKALEKNQGFLEMNGRAVFNFAAIEVPLQINDLLTKVGLYFEDIDTYIFHQGSKYIVETIKKRLGLPDTKVPIQLEKTGNTISSSIPLVLENYMIDEGANNIIISGFGVGLSWGTTFLKRI